ncbi:MAG TPA: aromatic ring-hydroxylating dioxygenase subunit alpha, partial [Candidatus Krumholzibacteria bacterium]|nr:aromatic ring-hydroxylating dioxygenase subunit alpha [Candidatus Krumholzibacteria bacterium]
PLEDYHTKLFIAFSYRLPVPGWMVQPVLRSFAMRIFRQDAWMLARQTDTIEHFGEESYKFTEIDVLSAEIFELLRRGRLPEPDLPLERVLRMRV